MNGRTERRVWHGTLGVLVWFVGVTFYGVVWSMTDPVDWTRALQVALTFAPMAAVLGALIGEAA